MIILKDVYKIKVRSSPKIKQLIDIRRQERSNLSSGVVSELLDLGREKGVDDKHQRLGVLAQVKFFFSSLEIEIRNRKTLSPLTCLNSSHSSLAPSSLLLTSSENCVQTLLRIYLHLLPGKFLLKRTFAVWASLRVKPSS